MTSKEDLQEFAVFVLNLMESSKEWSPDLPDLISDEAVRRGLSTTDKEGFFKVVRE